MPALTVYPGQGIAGRDVTGAGTGGRWRGTFWRDNPIGPVVATAVFDGLAGVAAPTLVGGFPVGGFYEPPTLTLVGIGVVWRPAVAVRGRGAMSGFLELRLLRARGAARRGTPAREVPRRGAVWRRHRVRGDPIYSDQPLRLLQQVLDDRIVTELPLDCLRLQIQYRRIHLKNKKKNNQYFSKRSWTNCFHFKHNLITRCHPQTNNNLKKVKILKNKKRRTKNIVRRINS